nr:MAG TPA: Nucleotide modification associated domain 1 [Crassvirales sp.]
MARNRKPKNYVVPIKDRTLTDCVDESLVDENVVSFRTIQDKLVNIYAKKNHDYGDSFNEGCNELGVGYAFSRIFDKTKRFQTLAKGIMNNNLSIEVQDETVEDTIMDLANYCVMYLAWRDKHVSIGEAEDKDFSIIEGRDNQVDIKHPSTGELESNNNINTCYHKLHDELFTNKVVLLQIDSRKDCTNRVTSKYGFDLFRDEDNYVYIKSVTGEFISVTIDNEYVISYTK